MLPSQASINAITQLVVQQLKQQQLKQRMSFLPNAQALPFHVNSPLANNATDLAVLQTPPLVHENSLGSTTATPPLSRENSFGSTTASAPLSRDSSISSTDGSTLAASQSEMNAADDCFNGSNDFEDDYESIRPSSRAAGKRLYKPCDKVAMNDRLMKRLDPLFLAPFISNLFRKKRKVGSDEFRKNPELVFEYFKELVKPVIRAAVASGPSNDPFLAQRYFWCAYDLVRKRRANHVQFWRKYGRPKHFCYGGKNIYEATYGKLKPIEKSFRRRAVRQKLMHRIKSEQNSSNVNVQMDGGANANVQMDGGANANDDQEFDPAFHRQILRLIVRRTTTVSDMQV